MTSKQDDEKLDQRLQTVYDNPGNKRELFDNWADTYDKDLIVDLGYVAYSESCKALMKLTPNLDACILDAGCGTGLVGKYLTDAGYTNIHGNDYSEKMLQQADATGVYSSLKVHDLSLPVSTDNLYDVAIAVGVFAFSIPSAEHLVNVTRCLQIGGYALITVNGKAWNEVNWPEKLEDFEVRFPDTKLLDIATIDYLSTAGIDGRLLTLQRIA
jgi:predicted TPR repeat methyltransferase